MAEDVEADAADFDPLHYVRLEMTAHEHVSDGHIIVDDLGVRGRCWGLPCERRLVLQWGQDLKEGWVHGGGVG